MKTLLTILLIAVSCCGYGQDTTKRILIGNVVEPHKLNLQHEGSKYFYNVATDNVSRIQVITRDTVPVIMLVNDTSKSVQSSIYFSVGDGLPATKVFNGDLYIRNQEEASSFEALSFYPHHPIVIIGYQVTENQYYSPHGGDLKIRINEIKYLNHLKQPLPERLIVWMVVRRKEK